MKNYLCIFAHRVAAITPQSAAIADTVPNSAGGHDFEVDDWARLDRLLAALPHVACTGTHSFQFASFAEGLRGWGRALRRAVGAWHALQPTERLAYQQMKYRPRAGWSHGALLLALDVSGSMAGGGLPGRR